MQSSAVVWAAQDCLYKFRPLGNSENSTCDYKGGLFHRGEWFTSTLSVEHGAKRKLSCTLHRIYMSKQLLCMPKSEVTSTEFGQLKNWLPGVTPWSDKGNKLNWQLHLSIHAFTEYCSVRVCRVGDVVLHEGFCKRGPCCCDCIATFLIPCLSLTHTFYYGSGKNNEDYFTTFKPCFKLDVSICLVWIPDKVGKTKVEGCYYDIHCYSYKWWWL